jgi:hypothetical protein
MLAGLHASAARTHGQVVDHNDRGYDEQEMNKAPANMQKQPQQPENKQHNDNGP